MVAERTTGKILVGSIPFNGGIQMSSSPGTPVGQAGASLVPLLDLSQVAMPGTAFQEGLTGLAFHPRFNDGRQYRYIFVRYNSQATPSAPIRTIVARYGIPTGAPVADPSSVRILFDQAFEVDTNAAHVSGQLHFDPRPFVLGGGVERFYLYFPTGDMMGGSNGVCNTAPSGGMLRSSEVFFGQGATPQPQYAGKLLRLNFDIAGGVAQDSPSQVQVEMLGKGLRNPYYFDFDQGNSSSGEGLGDHWLADTGSNYIGEIERITPIALDFNDCFLGGTTCEDFGWPYIRTRLDVTNPSTPVLLNEMTACWSDSSNPFASPSDLATATHSLPGYIGGQAILGGIVYRGTALSSLGLAGRYWYGINSATQATLIAGNRSQLSDQSGAINPDLAPILGMNDTTNGDCFVENGPGGRDYYFAGINQSDAGEILLLREEVGLLNPGVDSGTIYRVDP